MEGPSRNRSSPVPRWFRWGTAGCLCGGLIGYIVFVANVQSRLSDFQWGVGKPRGFDFVAGQRFEAVCTGTVRLFNRPVYQTRGSESDVFTACYVAVALVSGGGMLACLLAGFFLGGMAGAALASRKARSESAGVGPEGRPEDPPATKVD